VSESSSRPPAVRGIASSDTNPMHRKCSEGGRRRPALVLSLSKTGAGDLADGSSQAYGPGAAICRHGCAQFGQNGPIRAGDPRSLAGRPRDRRSGPEA
jgi:hypothetical protein